MIPDILSDASARMDAELRRRTAYRNPLLQERARNLSALMTAFSEDIAAVRSADPGNMERRLIRRRERLLQHLDETPHASLQEQNAEQFVAHNPKVEPGTPKRKKANSSRTWLYVAVAVIVIAAVYLSGLLEPGSAGDFRNLRPEDW